MICKKCKEEKKHFAKGMCNLCYWKNYRIINRNLIKIKDKIRYEKNREKELKYQKGYRQKPEVKLRAKEYYLKNKKRIKWLDDFKICKYCGNKFFKRDNPKGFNNSSICNSNLCLKKRIKEYRLKHKNKIKRKQKENYKLNREKILEQKREYSSQPEIKLRRKGYSKLYRKKNEKEIKKKKKEYYSQPEIKLRRKGYSKLYRKKNEKEIKKKKKEYYSQPEIKLKRKEYDKGYGNKLREQENKRREKLGLPLVGEGFKREMELIFLIKSLFRGHYIKIHERSILNRLELDIYLPEIKLAFEYMGEQHYNKKYFDILVKNNNDNRQRIFDDLVKRDKLKKQLCEQKGIILIEIKYNEELSEQLILSKLKEKNIECNQEEL